MLPDVAGHGEELKEKEDQELLFVAVPRQHTHVWSCWYTMRHEAFQHSRAWLCVQVQAQERHVQKQDIERCCQGFADMQDAETEAVAQDQNEYIEMRLVAELLPKSGKKAREEHRFGGTLGTCVWHVKRMASIR